MPPPTTPSSSDPAREPGAEEPRAPRTTPAPYEAGPQDSTGVNIFAYLLSGVVLFGGLGWLLDRWLGTSFIVGIGTLGGTALSLYLVWFRYGSPR